VYYKRRKDEYQVGNSNFENKKKKEKRKKKTAFGKKKVIKF